MMKRIFLLSAFLFLILVTMSSAFAAPSFQAHGETIDGNASVGDTRGFKIRVGDQNLTNITVSENAQSTGNRAYIMTGAFSQIAEATVNLTTRNASFPTVNLTAHTNYYVVINNTGGAYTTGFYNGPPFNISNVYLNWTGGYVGGDNPNAANVLGIWVEPINYTQAGPNIITTSLTNAVNGSTIGSVALSNVTGNLTFLFFNITGTGYCVSYSGNGTGTNCSTGNGASTYFNTTVTTTIIGTQGVTATVYQALLNVSAYRLYLNTTISTFNVTNIANVTTSGLVPANNGSNNIMVSTPGNYTANATCAVSAPLGTYYCNVTGIHDNRFTIGAKNSGGAAINNFSVTTTSTIGNNYSSTLGSGLTINLLQGYNYTFVINSSGYAIANVTLPANASTNTYNFTLLTQNTFDLRFYNESTNTQLINTTVYLNVISSVFSANYTTTNGTLVLPLLTPSDYQLTYYYDSAVPRDYYVTLSSQSYVNLTLYTLDAGISNIYLPIVVDQSIKPVENATVTMLRYYVDCNCYKTVEMTKTDTNGQGVLRVVPNIIPYKLIISKESYSFTTDPTKFTSSTNTYTLNLETNPLTSIQKIPSVSKSLTFNNATLTYTFTWSDTQNLVIEGCLKVDKFHRGTYTTPSNQCSSGASGSIIYTITDINETTYSAVGILETNTEYSTYYVGPVGASFTSAFAFGVIGLFIGLLIMIGAIMLGNEMGTDMMVLISVIALLGLAGFGIIIQSWIVTVPMLVLGIIVIYKTRT